jgi:broad specificity phosphatase PhoE
MLHCGMAVLTGAGVPRFLARFGEQPAPRRVGDAMTQGWPERLWVVRHGESAGNLARRAAMAAGHTHIETGGRDADVPLSPLGEQQARALGCWFAAMPAGERPEVVLTSPYRRARQTAALINAEGGLVADPIDILQDERLREKEFGVLDRLTRHGIA